MKQLIRIFNFECYWWGERLDLNLNFAFVVQLTVLLHAACAGVFANGELREWLGVDPTASINHASYIRMAFYLYVMLLILSWVGSRRFYVGLAQTPLLLIKVATWYLLGFFGSVFVVVPLLLLIVVLLIVDGIKAIIRASRRAAPARTPREETLFPTNHP